MYLIQQVTKQPTDEILGFFYDFGKEVLVQGIAKMAGRSIRKDIQLMYPGTAIPFKMLVEASKWGGNINGCAIYVMFPDNSTYIDTEKMIEMIMEKQLLGACSLPDFEPPKSKTPKMYKDLIEEVLKKHEQNLLDSGHTRETGSSSEALGQAGEGRETGSDEG